MWDWNFAVEVFPEIASALRITISATFAGFVLALVLGLFLTMMRRSDKVIISKGTQGFIEFIRNTPLLVQLYFIFYVFPEFGLSLSPFAAGVIGLGLHYSTYLSEVYRSGIDAVPQGQWEVGTALNFKKGQVWRKIIIPQAIPPVIPVLGNYLLTMFKETPLLSAITLVEILQTAKIIGSRSFRYLEAFTIVGILFLVLSYPSSLLIQRLDVILNRR
ncbi:ectoine/hydroxyectoine ABC transporter permease subunit EhuD [Alkalibacter rhizosphaerae]|uniref:Ectoine/hydroxyectoine ABC transporter permease subunit EhuD n=1 Tax=Alkalibacter rhizosphaerae TaxID=2815577 RepID=A0A974XEP6_9FIRM|nr:ectoine/hydroxyectoine ABC transporter permease subunit EhuD [Alkalibacter rhizosphaerae]QSX08443.1 ectoine/hydroxyectoine ABC transporter permease subunit EhuD [Alkalibacter rhizosphaerae]